MKNHYHLTSLIYIFFLAFISIQSFAQTAFKDDYVVQALPMNLDQPVGIVFSNNGLGFIWEKKGKVWTMEDDVIHDTPLIDITEEVNSAGDHGLVGFALDPSFRTNGYYYLYYVVDRHHLMSFGTEDYDPEVTISSQATISRITRYTADKNDNFKSTLEGSRKIILGETPEGGLPVLMGSHAPGTLLFGTDGSLLATYGDGGSYKEFDSGNAADTYHEQAMEDGILPPEENVGAFRSMMKSSGNGKMLRIDPETGAGLESNPFYDPSNPYSNQSRVWAMGFRNAYKFVQIPNTGEHDINRGKPGKFIVGDVGSSDW